MIKVIVLTSERQSNALVFTQLQMFFEKVFEIFCFYKKFKKPLLILEDRRKIAKSCLKTGFLKQKNG